MKSIPQFNNINQESEFWRKEDSTDFIDWSNAEITFFTDLKPTTKSISPRLPESMLAQLKQKANKQDIPYQSLIKMFISEGLERKSRF